MENNTTTMPTCPGGSGSLPSCAPLAVPYVPVQPMSADRYGRNEALSSGTLFPGLDLPFHLKTTAENAVSGPLGELQALEFVILELGLYLDTHQDDTEAFALYQQYVELERQGRERYEATYGPLFQTAASKSSFGAWIQDPWPWDSEKKGGN